MRTSFVVSLVLLLACDTAPANKTAATSQTTTAVAQGAPTAAKEMPPAPTVVAVPAPPDVAGPPADSPKTKSGLASKVVTVGAGKEHPAEYDTVKVHYTGWTKDGKMFDSSVSRGEPAEFPLNGVIPGWTEGLQLMVVGEKRRLWIPAKLAYGETPRNGAPGGDLTFDVELLEIKKGPKPPPVPEDVKAPPATAKKTASGIAYRVLKAGTGKKHATETSTVKVHYSGWTLDGKMFDSSVVRGEPASFALNRVIKGWTEGVALMVEGEKTRFWIPGKLAYGETPNPMGAPSGMLVFDIELLSIGADTPAPPAPPGSAHPAH